VTRTDAPSPVRRLRHDPNEQPFIVIWEVTRACQLACVHCRADAIPHRDPLELSTADGERLLTELAAFGRPRPLVVLTGGDPLERPDLTDLVAYGTARGLSVALSPSVTPRLTGPALAGLAAAGAKAISLSLDGATAAAHDRFRRVDGVFAATIAAIGTIRELGLRLQINTTVTADNAGELPDILRLAVGARAGLWSVFFLVPTGRGTGLRPLSAADTEDVLHWLYDVSRVIAVKTTEAPHFRRVALQRAAGVPPPAPGALGRRLRAATAGLAGEQSRQRPRRPPIDVNSGRGFAFVDHRGTVYPSGFLPVPVGSVRERPFTVIYRDAPLLRALRDPSALGGRCGACEFRDVCGGSRSRAYADSGDPLAEDPSCSYRSRWAPAVDTPAGAPAPRRAHGRPVTR
jgi:radical SAM protein